MNIADENSRLNELHSLNILDTAREERFDRHTRLVAKIFDVPTVLISLIDADRQWFKSGVGCELRETTRDESICSEALSMGYLEIPDIFEDEFFHNHPAAHGEQPLRFYAGVVLYGPTGQPIGTLCMNDTVPRKLSADQRSWLKDFARLVQYEINRDTAHVKDRLSIQDLTQRDPETGFLSEALLSDTLENLIRVYRNDGRYLAIMHLWVENFNSIGHLHGEDCRNAVLKSLVDRITSPNESILAVARVSADRFIMVMPMESAEAAMNCATHVSGRLGAPVKVANRHFRPDISLGISLYPNDGQTAGQLITRAHKAFNYGSSDCRIHLFSDDEDAKINRRLLIGDRLENALTENQLTLNYQPIFRANGSHVESFEALARWHDEELGSVSPGEFVPIAEKSARLSYLLTYYVLRMACAEAQTWQNRANEKPVKIAVNIPAREFYRPGFVGAVLGVLIETGLDPNRLILELTEEGLIQDIDKTISTMNMLSATGVQLALDDFGTGYSSLSHLRRLPVDTLKIDKSFIDDLPGNQGATHLAAGIIGIAHGIGVKVVAEGVEHESQQKLLVSLNCDKIQGYLLGRPISAEKIPALLNERSENRPFQGASLSVRNAQGSATG